MAFLELQAMQVAYELLSPLDPSAQQRVMAWLTAALADKNGVPAAVQKSAAEVPAEIAPEDSIAEVAAEPAAPAPAVDLVAAAAPEVAAEPELELEPEPEPVVAAAPDPRPRRGRSAKATGRRAAKAARPAVAAAPAEAAPAQRGDRPSGDEFLADLAAAGSFKALAEKYGKSIGTIGNWANQLREQGFGIPVGRQKKA